MYRTKQIEKEDIQENNYYLVKFQFKNSDKRLNHILITMAICS